MISSQRSDLGRDLEHCHVLVKGLNGQFALLQKLLSLGYTGL